MKGEAAKATTTLQQTKKHASDIPEIAKKVRPELNEADQFLMDVHLNDMKKEWAGFEKASESDVLKRLQTLSKDPLLLSKTAYYAMTEVPQSVPETKMKLHFLKK